MKTIAPLKRRFLSPFFHVLLEIPPILQGLHLERISNFKNKTEEEM